MIKKLSVALLLLALPLFSLSQVDTWTQKKDIGYYLTGGPTVTNLAKGFNIGTKGYVLTSDDDMENTDFWEYDPGTDLWSQKTDFPGDRRTDAVGFGIGSKGYFGLGTGGLAPFYQDFWEYDPSTNAWTAKANLPGGGRRKSAGFSIGTKGYVSVGEGAGGYLNDLWEYNPSTNSWLQRLNFPGTVRIDASAIGIGTKGYVGLGVSSTNVAFLDFWEYNPTTNTWLSRSPYPGTGGNNVAAFSTGTKGYFGSNNFYEFNPVTNSWVAKAPLVLNGVSPAAFFSIGTVGYVGLNSLTSDFWKYDTGTNLWSSISSFGAVNRYEPSGFEIDDKIYVVTGQTNGSISLNDVWEWDPATEFWSQKADFPGPARYQAVGFSIGSKGFIGMGTTTGSDALSDFYQYDQATNTWSAKANFGGGLRRDMVSFTIGKKGYVGTGRNSVVSYNNDFWEYNPNLDTWIQKANFPGGARWRASGFSINDKGYLGGGTTTTGDVKDFWEYSPSTNTWIQRADIPGTTLIDPSGFSLGSLGYLAGGVPQSYVLNELQKYDPFTNSWTQLSYMPFERFRGMAVAGSRKAYSFGGSNMSRYLSDFWEYQPENQINLYPLSTNSYCIGDTLHVGYSVLYPFNSGNIFTAQLSDISGSFANPTVIGTKADSILGSIDFVIPSGFPQSSQYRVRIVSSSPADTSHDNGNDISIGRFEQIVFTEQIGTVGGTTTVAAHEAANGFDNDGFTMTGTADIRVTVPSTGYAEASGGANVFFNSIAGRTFQIEGINTNALSGLQLRFGIYKNGTGTLTDLPVVEVSSNGTTYTPLTYSLPTGLGTAKWYYVTATGSIPAAVNLRIRITQNSATPSYQYRFDDFRLTHTVSGISSSPGYICNGSNVSLTAYGASTYLWSTNDSTTVINVNTAGNYYCRLTAYNGCSVLSNTISLQDTTPTKFAVTGGGPYCSNPGTGSDVGLDGSESGTNYQLMLNGATPVGSPVSGNGSSISFGLQTATGTYTVTGTDIATSCAVSMNGSTIVSLTNGSYYYVDQDMDTYGSSTDSILACSQPLGYVTNKLDCNDTSATAYQGATELCNNIDDDCDGYIDEGCGPPIYCIGPSASYTAPSGPSYVNQFSPFPTVKAAVTFLNTFSPTQHVIFEIQNNYAGAGETFPITITYPGNSSATAIFRPRIDVPSMLTIAGLGTGPTTGLIQLDGADYVTFDGSPGGVMGTNSMLRVRNTLGSGSANANFLFVNDATHNALNAITIEAGNSSYNCILIGTTTGTTGNDFNLIQNCIIRDRSDVAVSPPSVGINSASTSTGAAANSDISILGNFIINASDGIFLYFTGNNGNWTISNNHIYFTNASATFKISEGINVHSTEALTATISSNYVGGTAPFAGGAPMIETNSGIACIPISITVPNTSAKSTISGNVIKNYQRNGSGPSTFFGINVAAGPVDVINNIIGDPLVANDLLFQANVQPNFVGINYNSSQTSTAVSVSGNSINNVTTLNSAGASGSFTGITYTNGALISATATFTDNFIRTINYAGKGSFRCLFVSPGENAAVSAVIANNKFEGLNSSNPLGVAFSGIYCNRGNANIIGNRIGKYNTANDVNVAGTGTHYGIRLERNLTGNGLISNDTIANVNFTNTSNTNAAFGIYSFTKGSTINEVSGNVLKNISTASTKSDLESDPTYTFALTGISYFSDGSAGLNLSNNSIEGLSATSNSPSANPVVVGLEVIRDFFAASINISTNRIALISNMATNLSSLPSIVGIRMYNVQSTTSLVSNNMIALSNSSNTNGLKVYGIYDISNGGQKNYFYNSIAIEGTATGDAHSAAFWYNVSSGALSLKNNILHNMRSGGTSKHWAVVHSTGLASEWSAGSSNFNNLYTSNSATLGAWPISTDKTFSAWKSVSGGDANSKNVFANFIDPNSDLHLADSTNCELESTGQAQASVVVDFDGQSRHASMPDIGADEFTGVCSTLLNLKAFIEGYYVGANLMVSALYPGTASLNCDTVTLQLALNVSPYTILYSATTVLQTNGNAQFNFPYAVAGNNYYLVLKHRSSLETWSANPVPLSNGFTFDFSSAATQAYSANQKMLAPGVYALFSGDLNQDGLINLGDVSVMEGNMLTALFGYYPSDLTGDWFSESSDFSLLENNIGKVRLKP